MGTGRLCTHTAAPQHACCDFVCADLRAADPSGRHCDALHVGYSFDRAAHRGKADGFSTDFSDDDYTPSRRNNNQCPRVVGKYGYCDAVTLCCQPGYGCKLFFQFMRLTSRKGLQLHFGKTAAFFAEILRLTSWIAMQVILAVKATSARHASSVAKVCRFASI